MARKSKKRAAQSRSTDWNVGQPLSFPPINTAIKRAAQEAIDEAMAGPFKRKRRKKK